MKAHPYADILPLLEGEAFAALVADIEANGLMEPITVYQDMVLDGRNRLRACKAAGIEPKFLEFDGDDPLAFVLSLNLHRRHLNESQRGMVASRLEILRHGGARRGDQDANLPLDRKAIASMLNVSSRTVASAAAVRDHALPELIQSVDRGRHRRVGGGWFGDCPRGDSAMGLSLTQRELMSFVKQERRAQREIELGAKQLAWPTKIYGVFYADPPWSWGSYSQITGMRDNIRAVRRGGGENRADEAMAARSDQRARPRAFAQAG